jgi:hypothetical protein
MLRNPRPDRLLRPGRGIFPGLFARTHGFCFHLWRETMHRASAKLEEP